MAIDSVRLLTDSAAQLWRALEPHGPMTTLTAHASFETWLPDLKRQPLDPAEEQALRRDFHRLITMIDEISTLVRSHDRAMELVVTRVAES